MRNIGFKESLTIEFKSDRNKLSDAEIIDVVVAFANTDGGNLYLGVEDNGDISGLHKGRGDFAQLAALIANKTVPPVAVAIVALEGDVPALAIKVPRMKSIVASSSGKVLRRRLKADGAPENVPLYPFEIANRLSSLSLLDYSAQPTPDATCADLDAVERERLRNVIRSNSGGEQNLLELTDEELDKALRLVAVVDGKLTPTYAGLLLLGKKDRLRELMPTAEASVQVLSGTDIKVNESFFLPILAAFEKISDSINAWNHEEEAQLGLFRVAIPDIDRRAFREALVNAFCHRDYSLLGRVRVQLGDEGLTISNPGGFIEGISSDRLLDAEPHGRNPALADALKRIGLAERTGRGIDRIFEGSLLYGRLLPDYGESTENMVKLFIPKSAPDKEFLKMIAEVQKKLGRSLPLVSLLILNALKTLRRADAHEIAAEISLEETKVKAALESLTETGLTEAAGGGRNRCYILSSKAYNSAGNAAGYIRQTDIDEIRYPELTVKLAKKQGHVSRKDVADLLQISPPQAYRLLRRLAAEGRLQLAGKGRNAKYTAI